jgi:AAA domain
MKDDHPDLGGFRVMDDDAIPIVPLTVDEWLARELPPPDRLIGEWFTKTSRVYMSADTGLGKTSLGMALTVHGGAGLDFLHWRCHRPARILYIDGEMSRRLLRQGITEAVTRLGIRSSGALFLSKEDVENFPPLNTPAGHDFLLRFIEDKGGFDGLMLDNIMALFVGDQKDEVSWNGVLPLVSELTKRNIGQLWIDHTGHNVSRGYGSRTKLLRMDTAIHLTRVERADTDIAFTLEFRKARERTPETRADFEDVTIALIDDQWMTDGVRRKPGKPSEQEASVLRVVDEVICSGNFTMHKGHRAVQNEVWKAECLRQALATSHTFSTYRTRLAQKGLIKCDGELSWKP